MNRQPLRLVFVALAVLAGIGATQPSLPVFERQVTPFAVLDEAGREYALPFLGGLDVPRPQFVDIDDDKDLDLFVQEYPNAIWFFENTGSAAAPKYVWRTDKYQGLDTGEWFRVVDLDGDGDLDIVGEEPFSHIRLYRNVGTRAQAKFAAAETLKDGNGDPMFLDRQNIPAIVDLDCDKRLDFFVGRIEGHVARFEADAPGATQFSLIEERFEGIEIIGKGGSSRHGANALAFADFDGDKDLDLFWGDFFEAGVLLIQNIGPTCSTPSFQVDPVLVPYADTRTSGYNAPAPVDLDLDGDLDFLMGVIGGSFNPVATAADNFYHWTRTAADRFELRSKRFLNGIDFGSETIPAAADLDGDGDLDLVVGNKVDPASGDAGRLVVFHNEGTVKSPIFRQRAAVKMLDAFHLAPALGDLDGDGDPDLLLGTWNEDIRFFRNRGSAKAPDWIEEATGTIRPPKASMSTPALADLDGDRDLDLLVGQATGAVMFYRNDGSVKAPRFTLVTDRLDDVRGGRRSVPAVVDLDGDGLLDLVVGRENGVATAYRNAGTRTAARFTEITGFSLTPASAPLFADVDGDDRVDLISGSASGGLVFLRQK